MKNLILSSAILLAMATVPALAHASNNDPRIESIFNRQFAGAQNVKWKTLKDGYYQVRFILNGAAVEAFYDRDAELLGTIRALFYSQLPLRVIQTIDNKFADAVIIEVKEVANNEDTHYNILVEQKSKKYILKIGSLGEVQDKEKVLTR